MDDSRRRLALVAAVGWNCGGYRLALARAKSTLGASDSVRLGVLPVGAVAGAGVHRREFHAVFAGGRSLSAFGARCRGGAGCRGDRSIWMGRARLRNPPMARRRRCDRGGGNSDVALLAASRAVRRADSALHGHAGEEPRLLDAQQQSRRGADCIWSPERRRSLFRASVENQIELPGGPRQLGSGAERVGPTAGRHRAFSTGAGVGSSTTPRR